MTHSRLRCRWRSHPRSGPRRGDEFGAPWRNGNASGSKPEVSGSNPDGAAIYVDDATGRIVDADWWPGDP